MSLDENWKLFITTFCSKLKGYSDTNLRLGIGTRYHRSVLLQHYKFFSKNSASSVVKISSSPRSNIKKFHYLVGYYVYHNINQGMFYKMKINKKISFSWRRSNSLVRNQIRILLIFDSSNMTQSRTHCFCVLQYDSIKSFV